MDSIKETEVEQGVNVKGLKDESKRLLKIAYVMKAIGVIIAGAYGILVMTDALDFSKIVTTGVNDLPDIPSRLAYVCKHQAFGVLWVFGCLCRIVSIRARTSAVDPTDAGSELLVRNAKNILNNSYEQFVLSFVTQLILVQYIDTEHTVKYIPALNLLFVIGRALFALGYPKYRHLGIMMNLTPILVAIPYTSYQLLSDEWF